MLRSWHGLRAHPVRKVWKNLDIILATSTEPAFFIDRPHESPFNVGVVLPLGDFTLEQVGLLNAKHPKPLSDGDLKRLHGLICGHPYLTRKALYMLASGAPTSTVDDLFTRATDDAGPFGDHLRYYLLRLQGKPELISALRETIGGKNGWRRAGDSPAAGGRPRAARGKQGDAAVRSLREGTSKSACMNRAEAFAFVAGGTVQAGNGVYLARRADRELLEHCRAGDFSYILTSRQMGKSSLMIRTAERLAAEGVGPVIVDLTEFGAQTTAEQRYKGFLSSVHDQLVPEDALLRLVGRARRSRVRSAVHAVPPRGGAGRADRARGDLRGRDRHDAAARFHGRFLRGDSFSLPEPRGRPELERLSFVLIGVATPGDLIKDAARTPFNIGHRIELTDFTLEEAWAVAEHLAVPEPTGREVIGWTHRWTADTRTSRCARSDRSRKRRRESGQRGCRSAGSCELFLDERAETDSNLQFVRDMLTKNAFNREAVLRTYLRIRRGDAGPRPGARSGHVVAEVVRHRGPSQRIAEGAERRFTSRFSTSAGRASMRASTWTGGGG